MNIENTRRKNYSFITISIFIFAVFATLAYMFPYTGDDWAWGSQIGIDRLNVFFDNYNGRYFGNFLVLAITRSEVLKVACMAVCYYLTCYFCYKYTPNKKNVLMLFALMLFFVMPRAVFKQSVVWSAGFSNYVPSAIISLGYVLLIKNVINKEKPVYNKFLFILTFILGFSGALFIENITLFNICLGFLVVFYTLIKFKKVYINHLSFLSGAITGAVWMFSNTAYASIFAGEDSYRDTPKTLDGITSTCIDHGCTIIDYLVKYNIAMCCIVFLLLFIITISFLKKSKKKISNILAILTITVSAISLLFVFCVDLVNVIPTIADSFPLLENDLLRIIISLMFVLSVFLIPIICIEKERILGILIPLLCILVLVAPLIIVNPIGPRCFFCAYLFMMVFAVDLLGYIMKDFKVEGIACKLIFSGVSLLAVVLSVLYINVFTSIHEYDAKRNEFAKIQSDNGASEVTICRLPNDSYVWMPHPHKKIWEKRYCLFYGLNEDVKINVVTPEEFDEFYEDYYE